MASINDHLAEDMIFQILSWLPVLSLLRCISVCKSWKSIISNPSFIQAHLAISQKKQPFSALRVVSRSDESQDLFMDTLGENSLKLSLPRFISDVPQLLIRSCNGLVILSDIHVVLLYIWNPLIRMGKLLSSAHYLHLGVVNKIGFGFDSLSSDYKILRVVFGRLSDFLDGEEKEGLIVGELYSFNADSWKPIQVPKEMQGFKIDPAVSKCVCVGSRVLCLPGTDGILSFDLHDEVFRMHKYPASGEIISEVLDFEGSIALILRSGERAFVLTLWALVEVDGNLSWTEKFTIEPVERIAYVLTYLGDGKFVARDHSHACCFYDMKKGTFVQFRRYMSVVQFPGSLLSLEGFERREEEGIVAELYSFNADFWKPIQVPKEMQGFMLDPTSKRVCVGSRVLCLPDTDGILWFDLHDEVFRMQKYPTLVEIISKVLDFEGSIALILRSGEKAIGHSC
ncbi:hypothetical protein DCAR_0518530 [Daucus carota subsp. sativus]|uniref:F-box domain-containing protein n=1 Tax=Daucus carota subsp. sativus TaxID=79200 RepID=A0AAF1AZT3_DAUCS|nr:hypothetical protein DCAR_0518530 [Daucus carota subsp. sativus]